MNWEFFGGGVIAALVMVYLLYALARAERF